MLKLSEEIAARYTPEQQAYIEKYAAGLLVTWMSNHIPHLISPTIGDGFDGGEAFPSEETDEGVDFRLGAIGEVVGLLDGLYISCARQVGFTGADDTAVWQAATDAAGALNGNAVPDKYPTFPQGE